MAYQLILSSDTLDIGRQKINNFMQSSTGVWSSDTYSSYSILSTQGANFNQANNTQYSFVTGKNNSANTGNFQVITGGFRNRSYGSFTTILGGTLNKQKNVQAKYNVILNGNNNYINEDDTTGSNTQRSYNVLLNGANNFINGRSNVVLGGSNQSVGNYNYMKGSSNFTQKNPPNTSITTKGPQFNTLIGNNNYIIGGPKTYFNYLGGFDNNIINTSGNYTKHNFLKGDTNKINGDNSNYNFLMGTFIQIPVARKFIFGFGKGQSGSRLEPKTSGAGGSVGYQFFLGSYNTRKVRINFGSSPNAYITGGAWQSGTADFGEYFEWKDQNVKSEERTGFFVEIIDGKICIARSENVIGIISKTTAFIGDSSQDYWPKMYLTDEWGGVLKEKFDKYNLTEENEKGEKKIKDVYFDQSGFCYSELPNQKNRETLKLNIIKEQCKFIEKVDINVLNPDYNPENEYVSRKERPEWDIVGFLGKIRVRTVEQITGNAVDVDVKTGMAKNGTKYPVMQKNKDFDGNYGIVTIFFK